jgi:cellulose synthase operon protein C
MLAENPQQEVVWRTLYTLQTREGRFDDARATLERGLEAIPGAPNLQWALAGEYEREGNIEAPSPSTRSLYTQNSSSVIIANNLASLISTYRTDPESLDRAWNIARRLRGPTGPSSRTPTAGSRYAAAK